MKFDFRPHHFLCTLGFEGKGYSPEFVAGFARIAQALRESPDGDGIEIRVVEKTDSICAPCPNRTGKECATEAKIAKLDAAHASILGIRPGDRLSWGEAKQRLRENMTPELFEKACAPCAWRGLGVCRAALERLRLKKGS